MDTKIAVDGYQIKVLDGPYTNNDGATAEATVFAKQLIAMIPEMKACASQHLLQLHNDTWAEKEGDELSRSAFESKLAAPKIVIYDEEGAATVYFGDSDMFAGHFIEVTIRQGNVAYAEVIG